MIENGHSLCCFGKLYKICRVCLITAVTAAVILLFASDFVILTKSNAYNYVLGGDMVNFSAGFVRRGLLGEIIQIMNPFCQPFLAVSMFSMISILSVLGLIIIRMVRLKISFPFILAIVFSPSMLLMYRGEEFLRTDTIVIALNLAASCILLKLIFTRNKLSEPGGGKAIICINACSRFHYFNIINGSSTDS